MPSSGEGKGLALHSHKRQERGACSEPSALAVWAWGGCPYPERAPGGATQGGYTAGAGGGLQCSATQ